MRKLMTCLMVVMAALFLAPAARAGDVWNLQPTLRVTIGAENVMTRAGTDSSRINALAVVDGITPVWVRDGSTLGALWGRAAIRGMTGQDVDIQDPKTFRAGEIYLGAVFKLATYKLESGKPLVVGLTGFIGGRTALVDENVDPTFARVVGAGGMLLGPKWTVVLAAGMDEEGYGDVTDPMTGQPPRRLQALVSVRVPIPILEGGDGEPAALILGVEAAVHVFRSGFVGDRPDRDIVRFWVGIDPGALVSRFRK